MQHLCWTMVNFGQIGINKWQKKDGLFSLLFLLLKKKTKICIWTQLQKLISDLSIGQLLYGFARTGQIQENKNLHLDLAQDRYKISSSTDQIGVIAYKRVVFLYHVICRSCRVWCDGLGCAGLGSPEGLLLHRRTACGLVSDKSLWPVKLKKTKRHEQLKGNNHSLEKRRAMRRIWGDRK
ncbi:uncharacterized protein LOC118344272 [Juglans regia]|uniref:Uncharacterized protein LOC118344271 n=1 Tax=Juglans regia TaxID=51240 RepID=A0A6P9E824_JUGRE|nr:uncharacterized protein LOC118344271 [Juglans regia]XP_035540458.1 uncharacterized protein LOC118344272 [Juglans regia]